MTFSYEPERCSTFTSCTDLDGGEDPEPPPPPLENHKAIGFLSKTDATETIFIQ